MATQSIMASRALEVMRTIHPAQVPALLAWSLNMTIVPVRIGVGDKRESRYIIAVVMNKDDWLRHSLHFGSPMLQALQIATQQPPSCSVMYLFSCIRLCRFPTCNTTFPLDSRMWTEPQSKQPAIRHPVPASGCRLLPTSAIHGGMPNFAVKYQSLGDCLDAASLIVPLGPMCWRFSPLPCVHPVFHTRQDHAAAKNN